MRGLCLHSQCVCVCVTGFLMQHSIVRLSKYFNSRTKTFRSGTILYARYIVCIVGMGRMSHICNTKCSRL